MASPNTNVFPTPTQLIRKQLKHFFFKLIFLSALSKRFLPSDICLFFDSGRNRKLTVQTKNFTREQNVYVEGQCFDEENTNVWGKEKRKRKRINVDVIVFSDGTTEESTKL